MKKMRFFYYYNIHSIPLRGAEEDVQHCKLEHETEKQSFFCSRRRVTPCGEDREGLLRQVKAEQISARITRIFILVCYSLASFA